MDATLNPANQEQPVMPQVQADSQRASEEKSELMQVFENHVHDAYWAYRDLLKAIFEKD